MGVKRFVVNNYELLKSTGARTKVDVTKSDKATKRIPAGLTPNKYRQLFIVHPHSMDYKVNTVFCCFTIDNFINTSLQIQRLMRLRDRLLLSPHTFVWTYVKFKNFFLDKLN